MRRPYAERRRIATRALDAMLDATLDASIRRLQVEA